MRFCFFRSLLLFFIFTLISFRTYALNIHDTLDYHYPLRVHVKGIFYSTPTVTHDNKLVIASHNRNIYFFDSNGNEMNSHRTRGWFHATPTLLSDSTVSIGCYDGFFYFFDPDGNYIKKIKPGGFIFTEPVEIGESIAFGNNKGQVVFYNRKSSQLSHVKVKSLVHGAPLVTSDSLLVIGSNSKDVYFINRNRELLHRFRTNGWIMHSRPLELHNGTIVVCSYDKHVYALDKWGNMIWKFKTEGRIHGSPIQMKDETIVIGSMDGKIYLLSPEGELVARIPTGKRVVSSPAAVNDSVAVIGSYDHHLYFFDTRGKIISTYNAGGRIFSSPIVMDCGTVFCCTTKGLLSFLPLSYIEHILTHPSPGKDLWTWVKKKEYTSASHHLDKEE